MTSLSLVMERFGGGSGNPNQDFLDAVAGHPSLEDCQQDECCICGVRDCPHKEPGHYWKDGCPYCWFCDETCPLLGEETHAWSKGHESIEMRKSMLGDKHDKEDIRIVIDSKEADFLPIDIGEV